jgi:hypothetical protein
MAGPGLGQIIRIQPELLAHPVNEFLPGWQADAHGESGAGEQNCPPFRDGLHQFVGRGPGQSALGKVRSQLYQKYNAEYQGRLPVSGQSSHHLGILAAEREET